MNKIILKQNAVIQHDLLNVGKMVDERLSSLNIDKQVATDETIKSLKSLRAELNSEFKEFEEQRKTIKNLVAQPYSDLEKVYKTEVSEKYTNAISTLGEKINDHEIKVKLEKQQVIEEYFSEAVDFADLKFLKFEDVGLTINLSTTIKKYREQVDEFIARIVSDIGLIETQEHQVEILVEYKKDLNCSRAIQEVVERKKQEEVQKEIEAKKTYDERVNWLTRNGFIERDFEGVFVHQKHEDLYISIDDVKTRSTIEFRASATLFQEQIKKREEVQAPVQVPAITPPTEDPIEQPKILTAQFEVQGTLEQLKALNQFLKDNNLTYKNI